MNDQEALNRFIRENWRVLLEDPFPELAYKDIKKKYWGEVLKSQFIRPKENKITSDLIDYLFRNNIIENINRYEIIINKPFIKKYLSKELSQLYREKIELKIKPVIDIDPKKMGDAKNIEEIKDKITREVIKEKNKEINEAYEKRKEEYYAIPSILDKTIIEEPIPEYNKIEEFETYTPYWVKLKLKSDPFPGEGLEKIDQNIYDQIVYKTKIFDTYQKYITYHLDALFKNTLFFGEFGSGKTTFFEYIQIALIRNNIIPLYVLLFGEPNVTRLIIRFKQKLLNELNQECKSRDIYCNMDNSNDLDAKIEEHFKQLLGTGCKGFIIFIDDLHKNHDIEPAMEFLSYIQSYSSELRRGKIDFNFAVFVAGSLEWKINLQTARFSGSFSRFEDMPPITPKIAFDVINMRLKAFSENNDNSKQVQIDTIERAYEQIKKQERPITFRSFIHYIVSEFEKNNFDILIFNPFISSEIKNKIQTVFDNNKKLNIQFNKLFYGSETIPGIQNFENREKCLQQLIRLYFKKEILDSDSIIQENLFYYQRLAESGLISKKPTDRGVYYVVSNNLKEQNEYLIKQYGLSLEDYLIPIFIGSNSKTEKYVSTNITKYDSYLNELPLNMSKESKRILNESIEIRKELSDLFDNIINLPKLKDYETRKIVRSKTTDSIDKITKTIYLYEEIDGMDFYTFWDDYWFNTDSIIEYRRFITNSNNYESCIEDIKKITYLYHIYIQAYEDMFNFLINQINLGKIWRLSLTYLKKEEILVFNQVREKWSIASNYESAKLITEFFHQKLRVFLQNIFDIFYGYEYLNKIPQNVKEYAYENKTKDEKKGFSSSDNIFQYLNRHHYKDIITTGKYGAQNWNELFSNVFDKTKCQEFESFLTHFADISTMTDHLKINSITPEQQNLIYKLIMDSMYYTQKMNEFYLKILRSCFREEVEGKSLFYFSCRSLKDKSHLTSIYIGQKAEEVFNKFKTEKKIKDIPLDECNYIENYFNVEYRVFFAFISQLLIISIEELKAKNIPGKISIESNKYGGTNIDIIFRGID